MKTHEELVRYWKEQLQNAEMSTELRELAQILHTGNGIKFRYLFVHDNVDGAPALFALVIDEHGTWYGHRYYHPDQLSIERNEEVCRGNFQRILAPDETIEEADLPRALADFHIRNPSEKDIIPDLIFILNMLLHGPPATLS